MSPYRTPPSNDSAVLADDPELCPDGDLPLVLAILWLSSVVRLVLAIAHRETSAAEVTLAALAVVVIPYLVRDAIAWGIRRVWLRL